MKPLRRGFLCECGETHRFPRYVFAHQGDKSLFKCPKCERRYTIQFGAVIRITEPNKRD